MLVKLMLVFLAAMVGVAMLGNLLFPGALRRQIGKRLPFAKRAACPKCRRPQIGKTCDCGKGA